MYAGSTSYDLIADHVQEVAVDKTVATIVLAMGM
jgi:hypothetical protein